MLRPTTPAINLLLSGLEHDLEDVQAAKVLILRRKVSNRRSAICTPQYRAQAQSRTNPRALARSSASSTSRPPSAASRAHVDQPHLHRSRRTRPMSGQRALAIAE